MGFSFQPSLKLVLFLIVYAFRFFQRLRIPLSPSHRKLPPGPMKLPIIGNLHNLIGSSPHRALRDLSRRYSPLMHLKMGRASTLVISSSDMAREFTRTHDGLSPAPTRKLCMVELLNDERVRSFSRVREEEIRNLVDKIRSLSSSSTMINLSEMLHESMNSIMSRAAFGGDWERDSAALRSGMEDGNDEGLRKIIGKHVSKVDGSEDLVDALLRMKKIGDFPLTDEDLKDVIIAIVYGGRENSAKTVEWAMAELINNPRLMQKLQSEIRHFLRPKTTSNESDVKGIKNLRMLINETLRLHPPIPLLLPRQSPSQSVFAGYDIPPQTSVVINAWAIGRDPGQWGPDAETFNPERFAESSVSSCKGENYFKYVAFGAGTRMCPGISFGMANVELALSQLLYHFEWNLPGGAGREDVEMTEVAGGRKQKLVLSAVPLAA